MDPALGSAGVVFGRVCLVPCPGWVDAPFVRECRRAPAVVLVESEELPVLQDGKVLVADDIQLLGISYVIRHACTTTHRSSNEQWRLQRGPDSKVGSRLLRSQIAVSDLQHVEVVVAEEVAVLEEEDAVVDDRHCGSQSVAPNINI